MKAGEMLQSMLTSCWYNMDEEEMSYIVTELCNRINKIETRWTWLGDIIYGALVIQFGDYGTSPRSGWFMKATRDELTAALFEFKVMYNMEDK